MSARGRAASLTRLIVVGSSLLLPTLSLLPLGALYLWQNGYVLHWAVGAFCVVGATAIFEFFMHRKLGPGTASPVVTNEAILPPPPLSWNTLELEAWREVEGIARNLDVAKLDSGSALLELGHKTVVVVANRMHRGKSDPIWRFTLPEALALLERVSNRLGVMVQSNLPFADRLTLAQLRSAYRWRTAVDVAERAYDIWRVVRMVNPATAATNEARERLTRSLLNWGRDQMARRLAEAYVEEVGRAAIDLYSGRLTVGETGFEELEATNTALSDLIAMVPLNAVIVGGSLRTRRRIIEIMKTSLSAHTKPGTHATSWPTVVTSEVEFGASLSLAELEGYDVVVIIARSSAEEALWLQLFDRMARHEDATPASPRQLPAVILPAVEASEANPTIIYGGDFSGSLQHVVGGGVTVCGRALKPAARINLNTGSGDLDSEIREAAVVVREERLRRVTAEARSRKSRAPRLLGALKAGARAARWLAMKPVRRRT